MKDRTMGSKQPIGDAASSEDASSSARKEPSAKLGRDIQANLGQQLRAMYDDVVKQGVPDRFTDLLNQLKTGNDKGQR